MTMFQTPCCNVSRRATRSHSGTALTPGGDDSRFSIIPQSSRAPKGLFRGPIPTPGSTWTAPRGAAALAGGLTCGLGAHSRRPLSQPQSSPRHASRPSLTRNQVMPSAATGSAHHQPSGAFRPIPAERDQRQPEARRRLEGVGLERAAAEAAGGPALWHAPATTSPARTAR